MIILAIAEYEYEYGRSLRMPESVEASLAFVLKRRSISISPASRHDPSVDNLMFEATMFLSVHFGLRHDLMSSKFNPLGLERKI